MAIGVDPWLARVQGYVPQFLSLLGQDEDPYAPFATDIHNQVGEAEKQAEAARQALAAAQNKPAQTTSPGLDFGATLLGGLSQILAPQLQGNALAQGGLAQKNQDFEKMRTERLQTLESHYGELAARARQLGNTELSVKMEQKAEQVRSKRDKLKEAMGLASSAASEAGDTDRLKLQLANQLKIAGINADSRMSTALARYGLRLNADTGGVEGQVGMPDQAWVANANASKTAFLKATKTNTNVDSARETYFNDFAQLKQSEVGNLGGYVRRLRSLTYVGKEGGHFGLGEKKVNKRAFDDAVIAGSLQSQLGLPNEGEAAYNKLFTILKQGGFKTEEAKAALSAIGF